MEMNFDYDRIELIEINFDFNYGFDYQQFSLNSQVSL
jgi:hypothetical protein